MKLWTRSLAVLLALLLALTGFGTLAVFADGGATLTFTNDGITETTAGEGYTISGTTLTISAAGTYTVSGACAEGSIAVKKGTTGVNLILKDLDLACSTTAPLACNKTTEVTLTVQGTVKLTDKEDPANETSTDAAVADAFEGAAIKVKSGASLTIEGSGTLTADGSSCKNGIKGGATSKVTVDMDGSLTVKAANNGIAADGELLVKKGTLNITATNEGMKSEPDEGDTESEGAITVSGGTITINAQSDGIQATNDVTISGGTFTIRAQNDGIQSNGDLTISDGSFTITTFGGYNASGFNEDTMSAKGIKASTSDEDTENATNLLTITGGTFVLNTRDDAVHCDGSVEITGGTFNIKTGDDGVHADTKLTLGSESGLARDPDITITNSYEGLESANLYILSGRYYVTASDDGINAAGGNNNTDHFNPGGPGGGGPGGGGPGGGGPGGGGPGGGGSGGNTGDYSLNISGGSVYVNCNGDGLDSNGTINLTGGTIEVWSMSSGDNSPLDSDGTLTIRGATVFVAGAQGMDGYPKPQGGQTYKTYTGLSISSGKLITIKNGSTVVFNTTAPKSAQFAFYTSPSFSTSWTCTAGSGSVSCKTGNSWSHTWDAGVMTTEPATDEMGVKTYTCTVCGATETQTIPALPAEDPDPDPGPDPEPDEGFAVTFVTDAGSTLAVYQTQDVTGESILSIGANGSGADVSRSSATGEPDSTGDGQVNFVVTVLDGYTMDVVSATEGTYKNIKLVSGEGSTYVYRVTKITAETTVTVTTKKDGEDPVDPPEPETGFEVRLTAPENAEIRVYNTQSMTGEADKIIESGTTGTVLARDTQGQPDTSGSGQVNFVIVTADDYEVDEVSATGSYKNLKGPDETGVANGWRITKITAGDVAVTVTVKEIEDPGEDPGDNPGETENPFVDVDEENDWFADAVLWAISQDPVITNGTDETHFSPGSKCTRAEIVQFLWNAAGKPDQLAYGALNPFVDVSEDDWYYKAVMWAVANGITSGTDATHFSPTKKCTRAEVVMFLWNAAGNPAIAEGTNNPFTDVPNDAWYVNAVLWAVANGITSGTTPTTFAPTKVCTRAEVVQFLYKAQ